MQTSEEKLDALISLVVELKQQNVLLSVRLEEHILEGAALRKQLGDIHRIYFAQVDVSKVDRKATFRKDLYAPKSKRVKSNPVN